MICVITGTAAWEALRLKKKTLVVGASPFLVFKNGITYEPCMANFASSLGKALNSKPVEDEELVACLAALYVSSFEMKSSLLWGDYSEHSFDDRRGAVLNICRALNTYLKVN